MTWSRIFVLSCLCALGAADVSAQLASGDAREMLEAHNRWRARHQADPLVWSEQLAQYAEAWAGVLVSRHAGQLIHSMDARGVRPEAHELGYGGWGENLYWLSAIRWSDGRVEAKRDVSSSEVVERWGEEVQWYDFPTGRCSAPADIGCGHFTQVVWRTTTSVGCGHAMGADSAQVWVCSYDPPGNWVGEHPKNVLPAKR